MARRRLVRDVTLVVVAATAVILLPTAQAAALYEIRWWSLVTLSRYVHDGQETERGERRGRGVMVYEPLDGRRRHIRFSGPEGDGEGVLGLAELPRHARRLRRRGVVVPRVRGDRDPGHVAAGSRPGPVTATPWRRRSPGTGACGSARRASAA